MYALSEKVYKYRRSGTQKHFHLKEADIFVFTVLYYKRALTKGHLQQGKSRSYIVHLREENVLKLAYLQSLTGTHNMELC